MTTSERAATNLLEHFAKSHPRPDDGICRRCVALVESAMAGLCEAAESVEADLMGNADARARGGFVLVERRRVDRLLVALDALRGRPACGTCGGVGSVGKVVGGAGDDTHDGRATVVTAPCPDCGAAE